MLLSISGLSISIVYPTLVLMIRSFFKEEGIATATGAIISLATVYVICFNAFFGKLTDWITGFLLYPACQYADILPAVPGIFKNGKAYKKRLILSFTAVMTGPSKKAIITVTMPMVLPNKNPMRQAVISHKIRTRRKGTFFNFEAIINTMAS